MTFPLSVSPDVADALATGTPVVALESTIISHGLPRPDNLVAARRFEQLLLDADVVPATIAVLDGELKAGLTGDELERIATEDLPKLSMRDLPVVLARGGSGATTVAATSFIADHAGIRVFATGGLGGVHRGAEHTYDESADLKVLSEVPITVVSAGVKSILDIAATLERMESLGIIVLGYGTADFPSFWLRSSGHPLDWSVPDAAAVAAVMESREELGVCSAIVVANPLPLDEQLDPSRHDAVLEEALRRAEEKGIVGKDVTPFLLESIVELTGGESLEVNLRIAENNIRLAAEIATAWSWLLSRVLVVGDLVDDISVRVLDDVTEASDTNAEIRLRPGGSAGNVAAWLGHLGVDTVFCGRVGADAVERHVRALAGLGVEAHVAGDPGTTATIVLQLDREGERTMFVDRGANRGLVA